MFLTQDISAVLQGETNINVLPPPFYSESSPAVPVLPSTGPNCHVPTEQQQPVPRVLQEPSKRVSTERLVCVAVH